MEKLSFILSCVDGVDRNILTIRKFVIIHVRSTLHEKLIMENNRFKPVLITICKKNSFAAKKDTLVC